MAPTSSRGLATGRRDERYAENLARAVATAGGGAVDVTLVSPGVSASTDTIAPGVTHMIVPMGAAEEPRDAVGWEIEPVVRYASLVHVHASFSRFGQAAMLAAGVNRVPIVASEDGVPTVSVWAQAELKRAADSFFACSNFAARVMGGAATVVAGAVDTEWFCPPPEPRARNGFAFVGLIAPHKRIERAVMNLPAGASFIICGRAPDHRYLTELQKLSVGRDVSFVLDADDVVLRDVYRSVHAVVVAAEHVDQYDNSDRAPETAGLAVLEAAACATPAVVAPTGALPEFVVDGVTGRIVDDDLALADMLHELHATPDLSSALGDAARDHLLGRWDLPSAGRQALELYRGVIEQYRLDARQ